MRREIGMFLLGGVLNTGSTYFLFLIAASIVNYQVAFAVAFLAGVVFSYWFNATFVFRVRLRWAGLFAYPLVYLFQYVFSAALLGLLIERLSVPLGVAPLLVAALSFPATFVLSRCLLRDDGSDRSGGSVE